MIWRNESCFNAALTFAFCCRHMADVSALDRILEGTAQIQGNPKCWDEAFQNNECCSLNHNLNLVPHYNHMIWQIRMPDGRMVNVVQGQVSRRKMGFVPEGSLLLQELTCRCQPPRRSSTGKERKSSTLAASRLWVSAATARALSGAREALRSPLLWRSSRTGAGLCDFWRSPAPWALRRWWRLGLSAHSILLAQS